MSNKLSDFKLYTLLIIIIRNFELFLRDIFGLNYRPYKLLLELTEQCNSKCQTCHIWVNNGEIKQELDPIQLKKTLEDYGKNILWIALSGGEVTLYKNFAQLVELINVHCPNLKLVTFTTNAIKPQKTLEYAKLIQNKGYDLFVTISLDGDETTHDSVRGIKGNYQLAQQTYQLLLAEKISVHFGLTVSQFNSQYLIGLNSENINNYRAISFEHTGGIYKTADTGHFKKLKPVVEVIGQSYKMKKFSDVVEFLYVKLAQSFFTNSETKLPLPCEVIATNLHISPCGEIKPCMFLPSLGNIRQNSISELLKTKEAKGLRSRALSGNCQRCWMNCYAPHSIMRHPLKALIKFMVRK